MSTGAAEHKASVRAQVRARRKQRAAVDFTAMALPLAGAGPVAAYLAMPGEPSADALIAACGSALVPRTTVDSSGGPTLEWVRYSPGDDVSVSRLGIREPTGTSVGSGAGPLGECALVVIPALAVDPAGRRLGQGGGYYDRVLQALPGGFAGVVATLVFDDELLDDVAAQAHDCRVDAAITPSRVVRFTR